MNWYKKATNYPFYLLELIDMQGEKGMPTKMLSFQEIEEAKQLEKDGYILKTTQTDDKGNYSAYIINESKRIFKKLRTK